MSLPPDLMSWKPLDLGPLNHSLAAWIPADQIPGVAERLTRPCLSFAQSASADPTIFFPGETAALPTSEIYPDPINGTWEITPRRFDPGVAARMLQIHEGHPDPNVGWKPSAAEWKRARRLWNWTARANGLRVTPQQGRRPVSDAALVLYCVRVLCEATGKEHFEFSRSNSNRGAPGGPMWRALIEALQLAQSFLALCCPPYAKLVDGQVHAETVAEIIVRTRSPRFKELCRTRHLDLSADDVASQPAMYRVLIADARA
jgi:hypothetical protein